MGANRKPVTLEGLGEAYSLALSAMEKMLVAKATHAPAELTADECTVVHRLLRDVVGIRRVK